MIKPANEFFCPILIFFALWLLNALKNKRLVEKIKK
jgi:hypothetical protein